MKQVKTNGSINSPAEIPTFDWRTETARCVQGAKHPKGCQLIRAGSLLRLISAFFCSRRFGAL